jgi:hypothetical protein
MRAAVRVMLTRPSLVVSGSGTALAGQAEGAAVSSPS